LYPPPPAVTELPTVFKDLQLADRPIDEAFSHVDLLIGADFLWKVQCNDIIRDSSTPLVAIRTIFGWTLSGGLTNDSKCSSNTAVKNICLEADSEALNSTLTKFWDLESLGILEKDSATSELA